MTELPDFALDIVQGFTIPGRHARARVVRLGPVLNEILAAHGYPPVIEKLLAEALVLTVLLGSTLKDEEGQLTIQAQTESGIVDLLVCDWRECELRGYVKFDGDRLAEVGPDPTLFALFGKGYLAVTFDLKTSGQRYQGIVPLEGASLSDAAATYFEQSEQLPSFFRVAVSHDDTLGCVAGGLMIQHLPDGEEGRERLHSRLDHPEWEHVLALASTIKPEELTDPALEPDTIAWRLFNDEDEVRVQESRAIRKGCRCDPDYLASVLARFPEEERAEMADEQGKIVIDCAFCARDFALDVAQFTDS